MVSRDAGRQDCLYLQFAKAPQAGRVKTRLQSRLGARAACELHCELLLHTARQLQRVAAPRRELWVSGTPSNSWLWQVARQHGMAIRQQRGVDLGERMLHALRDGLSRHRQVILVGSDCPMLDPGYLREAALCLRDHDMVWGPAVDGGYVLVGARRACAACFRHIDWGSAAVMSQTLAQARQQGVSYTLLPERADVDRPEDLALWHAARAQAQRSGADSADSEALLTQGRQLCRCAD